MDLKTFLELELTIARAQTSALIDALESSQILLEDYNIQMVLLESKIKVLKREISLIYPGSSDIHVELPDNRIPFGGC
jgi:translation initiation factor 2B subunit (eIF-2B alpha/beta/delta family)